MNANSYSIEYDIAVYQGREPHSVTTHALQQTVGGYESLEELKADVNEHINALMRKFGISKATLHVEMTFIDPQGEYCDSDTGIAEYDNGTVKFLL